jgi:hypothetical protein
MGGRQGVTVSGDSDAPAIILLQPFHEGLSRTDE